MIETILGATSALYAAIALFFFRFHRRSGDRLFGLFACAFAVLACSRFALALFRHESETRTYLYVLRLLAFLLILIAILDKNRASTRASVR